jgi:hypothetical protein
MNSRWARISRLEILITALILCLVGVEGALRGWGILKIDSNVVLDRRIGWLPRALPMPSLHSHLPYVVVLGDSFTAPSDGYVARMQRKFRERGLGYAVQNLGVSGYGTLQELEMWRLYGQAFHPRVAVLAVFLWNDMSDNMNDIYSQPFCNINRPTAVLKNGMLEILPQRWLPYFFIRCSRYSYVIRVLYDEWLRMRVHRKQLAYYEHPSRWIPYYLVQSHPRAQAGYQLLAILVQTLKNETEREGTSLVVVAFDNAFTVESDLKKDFQKPPYSTELDFQRPLKEIASISRQAGVPFLDLEKVFVTYKKKYPARRLYHPDLSGHFTPLGEDIAASAITRFLIDRGLVSPAPLQFPGS